MSAPTQSAITTTGTNNFMRRHRENPDSPEMQEAAKQHAREVFALKMMKKQAASKYCPTCKMLKSECECWDAVNHTN